MNLGGKTQFFDTEKSLPAKRSVDIVLNCGGTVKPVATEALTETTGATGVRIN